MIPRYFVVAESTHEIQNPRRNYRCHQRDHRGWAIFVGWKGL